MNRRPQDPRWYSAAPARSAAEWWSASPHAACPFASARARASRVSTGRTARPGSPVLEGVGSAYVSHYWDALPGAAETLGSFAELAVESGVPRLVLLSGRGEEEAERGGAGRARLRRRADGPALDLVRPELQRGLLAGTGPEQRGCASGRRHARAVRRRRRHRRRRGRGADRRSAHRRALRAHRAAAPHVRGGGPGDLPGGGPRDPLRADLDRGLRRRGCRAGRSERGRRDADLHLR